MSEQLVVIQEDQQITESDLNKIGQFAQDGIDHVVNDGIDSGRKYHGFSMTATGVAEVTVAEGRFYANGEVFFRNDDGGVVLDLLPLLPAVTKKVVSIVVWGHEINTETEPRTFLVDVDTEQTEARAVATVKRRQCEVNTVSGLEAADPVPPATDANVLVVANVILTTAGIESITMVTGNALSSVAEVAARATLLEAWRDTAGARLDNMDATIAGIQDSLQGLAPNDLVFEVTRDVARLKAQVEVPSTYTAYQADRFLDTSLSDTVHANYLAKIEEGLTFADATVNSTTLALLNPIDSAVSVSDNFVLPVYREVTREKIKGKDGELSLAQYDIQTVNTSKRTRSRIRIRYGARKAVSMSSTWWNSGSYDPVTVIFRRSGETWSTIDAVQAAKSRRYIRVPRFWRDKYVEEVWKHVVETESINTTWVAQTYLNSEPGYLTSVGLFFTRKANAGNVKIAIAECDASGAPDGTAILAKTTITPGDIKLWPEVTKIPIAPTYLRKGVRYAIMILTNGNHYCAYVNNEKDAQGVIFYRATGGGWKQADITKDLAFKLYVAQFSAPRTEIQLQPLTLSGGISEVDFNFDSCEPDGTSIVFEAQVAGVWTPFTQDSANLFAGLPALLPVRAVLMGTTSLMPGFSLGAYSQVVTSRPRTDFTHISVGRTLPSGCTTITVTARLEDFDAGHHTCTISLLTGGSYTTVEAADAVVDTTTPDGAKLRKATFNVSPAITQYKIKIASTTDSALLPFHIAERVDLAFA